MSLPTTNIGLNITEENVQLIEIIQREDQLFLENVDEEFFEESLTQNIKEAKYIHILQNAFNEIVLRKPLSSDTISVTLPSSFFKVVEFPVDKNLSQSDLDEYISWEIEKLFPAKKSNYFAYDKIIINASKADSNKKLILFTIPVSFLKLVHKFTLRNNLKLRYIDNAHTAAVSLLTKKNKDLSQISLFVEYKTLSYFFVQSGNVCFESTKKYKSVSDIPQITKDVADEIIYGKINENEITDLILLGNMINDELKKNLEDSLNINLLTPDPFSNLSFGEGIKGESITESNRYKFSSATAIALRT